MRKITKKEMRILKNLKKSVQKYIKYNRDELGILTVVAEQLGFTCYGGQSMISSEEVAHFINDKNELLDLVFDCCPDLETIQSIKGED